MDVDPGPLMYRESIDLGARQEGPLPVRPGGVTLAPGKTVAVLLFLQTPEFEYGNGMVRFWALRPHTLNAEDLAILMVRTISLAEAKKRSGIPRI